MERNCVCFAYYVDDIFIGWYGDSFGSVCKTPKIYGDSREQLSTIQSNFAYKMKKINETSFSREIAKIPVDDQPHPEALALLIFRDEKNLKGRKVELRMVSCPIYDGPNPEFDKVAYDKLMDDYHEKMKTLGIFDLPAGSMRRMLLIDAFEQATPKPVRNSWIYANIDELKAWAENEPTEFLKVIKYTHEVKSKSDDLEEENGDVANEAFEEV